MSKGIGAEYRYLGSSTQGWPVARLSVMWGKTHKRNNLTHTGRGAWPASSKNTGDRSRVHVLRLIHTGVTGSYVGQNTQRNNLTSSHTCKDSHRGGQAGSSKNILGQKE